MEKISKQIEYWLDGITSSFQVTEEEYYSKHENRTGFKLIKYYNGRTITVPRSTDPKSFTGLYKDKLAEEYIKKQEYQSLDMDDTLYAAFTAGWEALDNLLNKK